VTAKRDSKSKPKKTERPKIKKETLRDLEAEKKGDEVRGGRAATGPAPAACSCN
jgi:hypothetical protein